MKMLKTKDKCFFSYFHTNVLPLKMSSQSLNNDRKSLLFQNECEIFSTPTKINQKHTLHDLNEKRKEKNILQFFGSCS